MDFHRRRRIESSIDLTPMVDTILQLFLIFLLSSSFIASAARLNLPKASAASKESTTPIVVSLDEEGRWFLNQDAVAKQELSPRLTKLFQASKGRDVTLRADRALRYEKVVEALVEINVAGADNVLLAYEQKEMK